MIARPMTKRKLFSNIPIEVFTAIAALSVLLIVGTVSFHYLEHWSWISSFYFSVVTLATVGYGDLAPTTDISRLFTAIYIIFGAAIAVASLGVIGSRYLEKRGVKIKERQTRGDYGKS